MLILKDPYSNRSPSCFKNITNKLDINLRDLVKLTVNKGRSYPVNITYSGSYKQVKLIYKLSVELAVSIIRQKQVYLYCFNSNHVRLLC